MNKRGLVPSVSAGTLAIALYVQDVFTVCGHICGKVDLWLDGVLRFALGVGITTSLSHFHPL